MLVSYGGLNVPLLFSRGVELLPFTTRWGLLLCIFIWNFCIFTDTSVLVSSVLVLTFFWCRFPWKFLTQSVYFLNNRIWVWTGCRRLKWIRIFFFLKHGFLKTQLQRSSLRSVYSINLTVVLLSFLVANGCCGKQCSQGQIRAEGSSFLLQTHAHRLQVSTFVCRRAQNHQWWCAECHHLPCLLSNIASQTFTVPCLVQHKGVFKNVQHNGFSAKSTFAVCWLDIWDGSWILW